MGFTAATRAPQGVAGTLVGTGLAALVLKPSVLGGGERTLSIAQQAVARGVRVVVSSSFESGLGTAALGLLAASVDAVASAAGLAPAHHGLGTLAWFADVSEPRGSRSAGAMGNGSARTTSPTSSGNSGAEGVLLGSPLRASSYSVGDASGVLIAGTRLLQQPNHADSTHSTALAAAQGPTITTWAQAVEVEGRGGLTAHIAGMEVRPPTACPAQQSGAQQVQQQPVFVLLHGFLGCGADWAPVMAGLASAGATCVALDLPGHGATTLSSPPSAAAPPSPAAAPSPSSPSRPGTDTHQQQQAGLGIEHTADAVAGVLRARGLQGCVLVGYSLGARVAAAVAVRHPGLLSGLSLVSGTPGIKVCDEGSTHACVCV